MDREDVQVVSNKYLINVVHGAKYGGYRDDGPANIAVPLGEHSAELVVRAFGGTHTGTYLRIIDANRLSGGDLWLAISAYPELGSFPAIEQPDPIVVLRELAQSDD